MIEDACLFKIFSPYGTPTKTMDFQKQNATQAK